MDIAQLDFSARAEAGKFVQFLHPATSEPMFDGDVAIGAYVRPLFSKTVMAAVVERQRAALVGDGASPDMRDEIVSDAATATVRLVGVTDGGRDIASDGFADFYDRTFVICDAPGGFAFQVLKAAQEVTDFLTVG